MTLVSDHNDTRNPDPTDDLSAEKVWDMIAAIDIAMLVTKSTSGLRGRPMSTIPRPDHGVIYILTEADTTAALDVSRHGSVLLTYQGRGDHVALQGEAKVDPDKALVNELWNPGAQLFWPEGPEAYDVVAVVINPGHADVWDGPGLLRGMASIVKGAIRNQQPNLGTRSQVDL